MPHICRHCNTTNSFKDNDRSFIHHGCKNCGYNTFRYQPSDDSELTHNKDATESESSSNSATGATEPVINDTTRSVDNQLKTELEQNIEGVRITQPGKYELNLMKLYKENNCVVTLEADGTYTILSPRTNDQGRNIDSTN
jgi:predicted  nucleic acid-binding Zn-ribbon protein